MIKRTILLLIVAMAVGAGGFYMLQPEPPQRPTFCPSQGVTMDEFSRCMEQLLQTDTNGDGKIG